MKPETKSELLDDIYNRGHDDGYDEGRLESRGPLYKRAINTSGFTLGLFGGMILGIMLAFIILGFKIGIN